MPETKNKVNIMEKTIWKEKTGNYSFSASSESRVEIPVDDICPYKHIKRPWLNYALIISLFVIFAIQVLYLKDNVTMFLFNWNLILAGEYWRLITPIFLHASIIHVASNAYFLYRFGDNCCDWFARNKYLRFVYVPIFILWGVIAGVAFGITEPNVYLLGSSGAILGCMGFYFIMYPHAQIKLWSFKVIPIKTIDDIEEIKKSFEIKTVSAYHYLWVFFSLQVLLWYYGGGGNIAYMAHIGGFIGGVVVALICRYAIHDPPTGEFYEKLWADIKELIGKLRKNGDVENIGSESNISKNVVVQKG